MACGSRTSSKDSPPASPMRSRAPSRSSGASPSACTSGAMSSKAASARLSARSRDTENPEDIREANHRLREDIERGMEGPVDRGPRVEGRVRSGARSVVKRGSVTRGPAVIGQDCVIGPETYVGPYTSIGDGSRLVGADIEASIVIGDAIIEGPNKIVNSLIGRSVTIRSAGNRLPKGHRLIVGENSTLDL